MEILSPYIRYSGGWVRACETGIELVHGIWAGSIGGRNGIVLGSRAGKRDFCLYTVEDRGRRKIQRTVIDEGTGTAQLDVGREHDRDAGLPHRGDSGPNSGHGRFRAAPLLDYTDAVFGEKTISGSIREYGVFDETICMMASGSFHGELPITRKIPLDDIVERGFHALIDHKEDNVKVLVTLEA